MTGIQITEDVFGIELRTPFAVGPVNVYLVKKDSYLLLVDAGVNTDEAWADFLEGLHQFGFTPDQITTLFLTHHHPDHTGFVSRLSTCEVYGHPKVVPWLKRDPDYFERYNAYFINKAKEMGVPAPLIDRFPSVESYIKFSGLGQLTETLLVEDRIPHFEEWEIIETLGHAQSHYSLFRKEDGVCIAGDAILERITSNALMEAPFKEGEPAPKPLIQYRETLSKSMALPINKVLPGHGAPFAFSKELIARKLRGQERRRATILSYLSDEGTTPFGLAKQLFPDVYMSQLDLVLSEVQGHLEWLEEDEVIQGKLEEDGVMRYIVNQGVFGKI